MLYPGCVHKIGKQKDFVKEVVGLMRLQNFVAKLCICESDLVYACTLQTRKIET